MEDAETKAAVKAAMAEYSKAVVGDDVRRQEMCMQEIQKLLAKYDCAIVPRCTISPRGVEFMLETIAKPRGEATGAGKKLTGYAEAPPTGAPDAPKARQVSKKGKGQSGRKGKKG